MSSRLRRNGGIDESLLDILEEVVINGLQFMRLADGNSDVVADHQAGRSVPSMRNRCMATCSANSRAPLLNLPVHLGAVHGCIPVVAPRPHAHQVQTGASWRMTPSTPPSPGLGESYAYGASKAAVHHLSRNLARQLAPRNITSNVIAPGPFSSKRMAFLLDDPVKRREVEAGVLLGRIGSLEDMAGAAIYVASRAGAYATGTTLVVDGGSSACR